MVQHAHQKGIIHRDLKPSNILVALHDGKPSPKVIDFGIAKAIFGRLTDRTLYTEIGRFIGTPEYMAPEQTGVGGLDVDTRADIYSLGVILYELLTGTPPFDPKTLRNAGFDAMAKIIRELEPPKPSTRLSTLAEEAVNRPDEKAPKDIAGDYDTDFRTLRRQVSGDLDWITLKALEKDRTRRYATPSALAEDLSRHLSHEPVLAGPTSAGYRLRKFARRHKALFGLVAILVFGLVGTSAGLVWALGAERRASDRAVESARVTEFLADTLASADPSKSGKDVLLRDVLADAARKLGSSFAEQPLIEAQLRYVIGKTYLSLGIYDEAERHLSRAVDIRTRELGDQHADTIGAMNSLGWLYHHMDRYDELEALSDRALKQARYALGEENRVTLEALRLRFVVLRARGRYEDARLLDEEYLEVCRRTLGAVHWDTLQTMADLAWDYRALGRYEDARVLDEQNLESRRRTLGAEHPETQRAMYNLAWSYARLGRHADAEALNRQSLEIRRRTLGPEHPDTLKTMRQLAENYDIVGRFEDALVLNEQSLEASRRTLGPEHWDTLWSMENLARTNRNLGRFEEALGLDEQVVETRRRTTGPEHPRTLQVMHFLAWDYRGLGRYEEARVLDEQVLEIRRRTLGPEHPDTLESMHYLAHDYQKGGRLKDAERLEREWIDVTRPRLENKDATAKELNHFAWHLVTIEPAELRDPAAAMHYAGRACAAAERAGDSELYSYLDTLALAQRLTGDTAKALETQKRAVSLMPKNALAATRTEIEQRLVEYEAALDQKRP